jgi:hypothetical protein
MIAIIGVNIFYSAPMMRRVLSTIMQFPEDLRGKPSKGR